MPFLVNFSFFFFFFFFLHLFGASVVHFILQFTFTREAIEDGLCVFKLSIIGMGEQWNI
jgi:hypothetical protein